MQVFTTRVPVGVIAAIIPWNSQMFLTAVKLAPALAMGNTIVIKASEIAPTPLLEFAKNLSENCKVGGYIVGTCYDGKKIFDMLKNKNLKSQNLKKEE